MINLFFIRWKRFLTWIDEKKNHGIDLVQMVPSKQMMNPKKTGAEDEKNWENPVNPGKPVDERDEEKVSRQYKEAKRRKQNLTETDHIDKNKLKIN
ncbi:MAG: hypothetical protein ACOH2A_10445 [Sphingobacteriaceae bacterium]